MSSKDWNMSARRGAQTASGHMSRRDILSAGVGLGALAGGSAFPLLSLAQDARFKIPIAQTANSLFYLTLYTGMDKGLFKQEGVEIDLITAGGSAEAVNAVVSKQAACSTQDPVRCEAARQKGAPTKLIGASISRCAAYVVGKKDISPGDPKTWKGRKIAVVQRPNTVTSAIDFMLLKAGWKQERPNYWTAPDGGEPVQLIEVKQNNEFQALLAGAADMASGHEPGASDAIVRDNSLHLIESFPKVFGPFLYGGWCAYEDDIKNRPEMLQSFMNGIAHSYKYTRENPQVALETAKKWFSKLEPKAVEMAFQKFVAEDVYPTRTAISEVEFNANFKDFLTFVKYPLEPTTLADATYLEFAKKADAKFGL